MREISTIAHVKVLNMRTHASCMYQVDMLHESYRIDMAMLGCPYKSSNTCMYVREVKDFTDPFLVFLALALPLCFASVPKMQRQKSFGAG